MQMANHLKLKETLFELDERGNMVVWRDGKSVQVPAVEVPKMLMWLIRERYPLQGKYREMLADAAELLAGDAGTLDSEQVKQWQDHYQALIRGSSSREQQIRPCYTPLLQTSVGWSSCGFPHQEQVFAGTTMYLIRNVLAKQGAHSMIHSLPSGKEITLVTAPCLQRSNCCIIGSPPF